MIISFFGHGHVYNKEDAYEKILSAVKSSIENRVDIRFYCGGYGDFDRLCVLACQKIKENRADCEIVYISPYIKLKKAVREQLDLRMYDATIYPPIENTPLKFAISKRNRWMVDEADIIIAYVSDSYGGAFYAVEYAKRRKKIIINLAEL